MNRGNTSFETVNARIRRFGAVTHVTLQVSSPVSAVMSLAQASFCRKDYGRSVLDSSKGGEHAIACRGGRNVTLSNWADTLSFQPQQVLRPTSIADLRAQVQQAIAAGKNLRPLGALYSFSNCIATNQAAVIQDGLSDAWILTNDASSPLPDLLDTGAWQPGSGAAEADPPAAYAWVEGGTLIETLCVACRQRNLGVAPFTLGGSTGQTLVGAVSTSTHGADFNLYPLPEYVAALHLVSGGNRDLWLERPPAQGQITKDAGVANLLGVPASQVLIDRTGTGLNAALVSLGAAGVVAGALVRLRTNDLMNERMYQVPWSSVRQSLISGQAFVTPPGENPADSPGGTYRHLEVFLNAYDATPTAFVVARNELPNDGRAVPPLKRGSANIAAFVLKVGSNAPDYSGALATLITGSRLSGAQSRNSTGWLFYRYLDVLDVGVPSPQPVYSYELCWDTLDTTGGIPSYIAFLERAAQEVRAGLAIHRPFLGTLTLRFARGTAAFLGMQTSQHPAGARFAHVEISPLQDVFNRSTALPAQNASFLHAVFSDPSVAGARPHWGQGVFGSLVFDAGRCQLTTWQQTLKPLVAASQSFQSDFCRQARATF
jgi:hypothetical protein